MIHNLWQCFETTGDIHTYLSFKEYEKLQSDLNTNLLSNDESGEVIADGMSE